jgi:hypothetical protein
MPCQSHPSLVIEPIKYKEQRVQLAFAQRDETKLRCIETNDFYYVI